MVNTVWSSTLSTAMQPCGYTPWCVSIEECDEWQGSPMVCGLWLMGMSGTCGCFHDSAIHMCASLPITTNPLTTHSHILLQKSIWGPRRPGDLPSCICWVFGYHFSSNAFSNHSFPLFLLLQQPFLALSTCLSHLLRMHILEE